MMKSNWSNVKSAILINNLHFKFHWKWGVLARAVVSPNAHWLARTLKFYKIRICHLIRQRLILPLYHTHPALLSLPNSHRYTHFRVMSESIKLVCTAHFINLIAYPIEQHRMKFVSYSFFQTPMRPHEMQTLPASLPIDSHFSVGYSLQRLGNVKFAWFVCCRFIHIF